MSDKAPNNVRYPWYIRIFFWNQKRRYGKVLEPSLLWGRIPPVFSSVALLFAALDRKKSPIEPQLRALICVRISQINWCEFCVDINSMLTLKRGTSDEKLADLANFRDSVLYTEREKAALNYAEKITLSTEQVKDQDQKMLEQHFSEQDIVELTALIAFQNMSSKFNATLNVKPQGFCAINPAQQRTQPKEIG